MKRSKAYRAAAEKVNLDQLYSPEEGGKIEFRTDRYANLHFLIGKVSFGSEKLAENYFAALDEILRLKPNAAKGRYLRKITVSSTMGPGVQIDPVAARDAD